MPFARARAVAAVLVVAAAGTALLSTPAVPGAPAPAAAPASGAGPRPGTAPAPGAGPAPAAVPASAVAEARSGAAAGAVSGTAAPAVPEVSDGSVPAYFTGKAFDTCEAPSLDVMRAWRGSPYGAVGIYFAGRGRGCPGQRELGPGWVDSVHAMGWRLLPVFVGSQAPCVEAPAKKPFAIGSSPWEQGTAEGGEAVRAARALGLGTSSPLYLDIESYRRGDAPCAATTLTFVRGWNREVRRLGYLPGFYSSADTGVRDMEAQRKAGTQDLPSVMWFARWTGQPSPATEAVLSPAAWTPHARIHQYAGNVSESYGGHRLVIDRNAVDAPVARPAVTRVVAARDRTGP
ncbi:DUF1906 domain-containing protein [Streptomyces sp. NPDC001744]|uniref:DUF1906 domain-containing protein n=1 Tax=Streptomyces sp. NPDC001744 TaxID=3364606 RepID=UPI003677BB44